MSAFPLRGPRIAVVAPCGVHQVERFEAGLAWIRGLGLDPVPFPDLLKPDRYLASPDAQRRDQLVQALTEPGWDAVWIARGGYGMTRILDDIDLTALPKRPVFGFSDVTALFNGLVAQGGLGIHAPVVHSLAITDEASKESLKRLILGGRVDELAGRVLIPGYARGRVVGGNLCLIAATCGTRHQLEARGAILLLEEVGEAPYKIDRYLQQLRSAGVFEGVVGVAFGEFIDCKPPEGASWRLEEIFHDAVRHLGVPVLVDLPVGHGARNQPVPLGVPAEIVADRLVFNGP